MAEPVKGLSTDELDALMDEYLATTSYAGKVRDWRETPETAEDGDDEDLPVRHAETVPETPVHEAADAHVDQLRNSLNYAFAIVRHSVDLGALNMALDSGKKLAVGAVLMDVPDLLEATLDKVLPPALHDTYIDGGIAGAAMIVPSSRAAELRTAAPRRPGLRFDVIDPRAIDWALRYGGILIKGLVQTTREGIGAAIASGLAGELSRPDVIDAIFNAIGDADRSETIARTETMRAANAGLAQSWQQAKEKGYLTGDNKKQWIATGDDITCDICERVNGETVRLDQSFSVGGDPPAHPNCRCTMGIVG